MVKTKRAAMALVLGILFVLFSTAFTAAPIQTRVGRTASSPTTPQQLQFGWSGWSQVPGNGFTSSGPAPTFYNGNDYVFVRGTNNHIYLNTFNGTTWSGWSEVPGHGLTPSAPAATTYKNTLSLFVRGTDNKIYANTFNGTTWSGWSKGLTLAGPTAAIYIAPGGNFLDLFVRGTNNHLYVNTLRGTTWSGWSEVPGNGLTPSAPAATSGQLASNLGNTLYLFARGTDNKINANTFNGTTWSGWSQVPGNGSTPDAPGAMAFQTSELGEGQVDLFVRGTNDRIYVNILQATQNPCATPPGVQPVSPVEIGIGNTNRPRIALTFDAGGPSAPTTQILDILARHNVHSTFFITGDWANLNPDLVRRIHNDGHEIGNHTMHHIDLRTLSDAQVCTELNQAEQVLSGITGVSTRPYFRAPYGGRDSRIWNLAANLGYRSVYWTIDTLDWQTTATTDSITKIVMDGLRNGVIVLMHAGSTVEAQTLDGLMTKIEQQGYQMVTVTEVLQ